ncbi:MAG TPA: hypothetical protein VNH15_07440 [Elusimicrobiota bacterium]|nr:hypothetical protein [Elusimicrobiota bacterium]
MKSFKTLLCAVILAATSTPLRAQQNKQVQPSASRHEKAWQAESRKEWAPTFEHDLQTMKPKLAAIRQGKLSPHDSFVVYRRMMMDYSGLGLMKSTEAVAISNEWKEFMGQHPQLLAHPPTDIELPEERAAREAYEAARKKKIAEVNAEAKHFVPKDSESLDTLGYGRHMVLVYQYHLEFYDLPAGMEIKRKRPSRISPIQLYVNGQVVYRSNIAALELKPFKVMTFQHRIQTSRDGSGPLEFHNFIWVCDDLVGGYSFSTDEEYLILSRYPHGIMPWLNKSAEYKEFCGAISPEGKIIYQLPIKQHVPDTAFKLWDMNRDDTATRILVGRVITNTITAADASSEEGGGYAAGTVVHYIGDFRKTLLYIYPDKLETFTKKDGAKLDQALKKHGFISQ